MELVWSMGLHHVNNENLFNENNNKKEVVEVGERDSTSVRLVNNVLQEMEIIDALF